MWLLSLLCQRVFYHYVPTDSVTTDEQPFHWDAARERSFQELKGALTNAPVLAFQDYSASFVLYTDASTTGFGAVLMQPDDSGKNRDIAYASRTLNPAETNNSVTHLKGLAVVWALKLYHDVILGYKITVFTDHAAISELFRGKGKKSQW